MYNYTYTTQRSDYTQQLYSELVAHKSEVNNFTKKDIGEEEKGL